MSPYMRDPMTGSGSQFPVQIDHPGDQVRDQVKTPPWHYLLVAVFALVIGATFLRGPGFGDDLTYWTQGFEAHEHGWKSIDRNSFHDLRWPVWGVSYVIQGVVGFGMASYSGVPLFYL